MDQQPSTSSQKGNTSSVSIKNDKCQGLEQLYNMDNDPGRRVFLDSLFGYMDERGTTITRLPIMAKAVLDLYQLYKLVIARGGLVEVINKKLWQEIIKGLNLPSSITSAAFTLRTQYMRYLYPYECDKHKFSAMDELKAAIDGNRRESRRTIYAPNPPKYQPQPVENWQANLPQQQQQQQQPEAPNNLFECLAKMALMNRQMASPEHMELPEPMELSNGSNEINGLNGFNALSALSAFNAFNVAGPSGAGPSGAGPSGAGPSGAGPSGAGSSAADLTIQKALEMQRHFALLQACAQAASNANAQEQQQHKLQQAAMERDDADDENRIIPNILEALLLRRNAEQNQLNGHAAPQTPSPRTPSVSNDHMHRSNSNDTSNSRESGGSGFKLAGMQFQLSTRDLGNGESELVVSLNFDGVVYSGVLMASGNRRRVRIDTENSHVSDSSSTSKLQIQSGTPSPASEQQSAILDDDDDTDCLSVAEVMTPQRSTPVA